MLSKKTVWVASYHGNRTLAFGIDAWVPELIGGLTKQWHGTVEKTVTPHEWELEHADLDGMVTLIDRISEALANAFNRPVRIAIQTWETPQEARDRVEHGWPVRARIA